MKRKLIICTVLIAAVIALSTIVLNMHEERKELNNAGQNDGTTVEQIDDSLNAESQEQVKEESKDQNKTESQNSTNSAGTNNPDDKTNSKTPKADPKDMETPKVSIF